jgi:hypothetical protein
MALWAGKNIMQPKTKAATKKATPVTIYAEMLALVTKNNGGKVPANMRKPLGYLKKCAEEWVKRAKAPAKPAEVKAAHDKHPEYIRAHSAAVAMKAKAAGWKAGLALSSKLSDMDDPNAPAKAVVAAKKRLAQRGIQ